MLLPVELIVDPDAVTPQGPPPEEFQDFMVMREMGWTWEAWEATPRYVRQYVVDILGTINEAQARAARRAARRARG